MNPGCPSGVLTIVVALSVVPLLVAWQEPKMPSGPLSLGEWPTSSGVVCRLPNPQCQAVVLVFMTVDCPIANRYSPELSRLAKEFSAKGVEFYRVYVDPSVAPAAIDKHGKDFQYTFPGFTDADQKIVKAVGATVTPQAAVIDRSGNLVYRGRIDDRYVEHGKLRRGTYRRDLREALLEILAGKPVSVPQTPALGCAIPVLRGR